MRPEELTQSDESAREVLLLELGDQRGIFARNRAEAMGAGSLRASPSSMTDRHRSTSAAGQHAFAIVNKGMSPPTTRTDMIIRLSGDHRMPSINLDHCLPAPLKTVLTKRNVIHASWF